MRVGEMFTTRHPEVNEIRRHSVLLYTTILLLLTSATCVPQDEESAEQCKVSVCTYGDSVEVALYVMDSCDILSRGFLIVAFDYESSCWDILWGSGDLEECSTRHYLLDLDGDTRLEILTLYENEDNIWGYAHRYRLLGQGGVALQTLPIPYIHPDDVLYRDRCMINVNGTFTLLGETYEGDEHLTVFYDTTGDSLALRTGW